MKNNKLYESFAEEIRNARNLRYKSYDLMANQRRERSNDNYLARHNGDWFSCYDLGIEKNNDWTVITDIFLTFRFIYQRYLNNANYSTRIFIERCNENNISNIKDIVLSDFKHKKYQCHVYNVTLDNAKENVAEMRIEIAKSDIPAIVFVDANNHTYDDVANGSLSEDEICETIEQLTADLLPKSGILVYFERQPEYDGDSDFDPYPYDNPDRNNASDITEYPDGYGTMEIDFDNMNEGQYDNSDSQVTSWAKRNNESFRQAVNIFANYIMSNDVSAEDFVNATDLDQCDGFDFQNFYDIVTYNMRSTVYQRTNREIDELTQQPYELKKLIEKYYIPNGMIDIWEQTINDEWVDILEDKNRDDLIEAIYDLKDVSRITNKFAYGGGDYEILRALQLATVEEVGNRIKAQIRQNS